MHLPLHDLLSFEMMVVKKHRNRFSNCSLIVVLVMAGWLSLASHASAEEDGWQKAGSVRIAVIGDYGDDSQAEADVAALVRSWKPDFVVTTGDNNYPAGAADTIDETIGRSYHEFIAPYSGAYGPGADTNRFFPTLGNHDWDATTRATRLPQPYLNYFELPGNERYYDVALGPVQIFAVDSDYREPDGSSSDSIQAAWLRQRLAASTAPWKLVLMHEPPYSSGLHGSSTRLRWPYQTWGASAVFSGHDHTYERVVLDGFPYFVNGLGGSSRTWFVVPIPGSQVRYNADSGAMLIEASRERITFKFISRKGQVIDRYTLTAKPVPARFRNHPEAEAP